MKELIKKLYPICRSITGNGVRESLDIIKEEIPTLDVIEIPSGTKVYDWTVPKEWNILDAWVKDSAGNKIIDFKINNLHLVNYSIPINIKLGFSELKKHIHTLPDNPDWIPYRTTYYNEDWGFCISHNSLEEIELLDGLTKKYYLVRIYATLPWQMIIYLVLY